jgi:hypothetical protein
MLSMVMNDSIGYLIYMFSETNLTAEKTYVVPDKESKYFLNFCLYDKKADLQDHLGLNRLMTDSMLNFYNSLYNLHFIYEEDNEFNFITKSLDSQNEEYEKLETYLNDMTYNTNYNETQTQTQNPILKYLKNLNQKSQQKQKGEIFVFTETDEECINKNECNNYNISNLSEGICGGGDVCVVLSNLIKNESLVQNILDIDENENKLYDDVNTTKNFKALIKSYKDYYDKIRRTLDNFEKINLISMVNPLKNATIKALEEYKAQIEKFKETYEKNGNVLSFLNCKYLYYDLNIIYYALSELASKTRSLCGITTSMAFFLAIAVYSTIWAMHHYDRELFDGKKKKRRLSKHGSSHHHTNHSKTKAYNSNEKYINNINEDTNLSKNKTTKNDNKSKKKKILNETELSLKKDNTSLKVNILIKFILIVINL